MTQRISSSSSSAASAAAQSSRQRNKRRVMEPPTLPRKSQRKTQNSSSSLAQQRNESEEPSRKRVRQNGTSGASLASESSKRRSSSAAAAAAAPTPAVTDSTRNKSKAKVATDKEATAASQMESKSKKVASTVKPLEIVSCGICFEESYEHAGALDCCQHAYCFPCISKWAEENSNTCPQCKRRIRSIRKMQVSTGKRISTKKIKKRDLNSSVSGSGGVGVINFGAFHLNPPEALHFLLQHVGGGSHDPIINPLMYHILFHSASDYDDDEEDEDFVVEDVPSDYSEEDVICPCCTFAWDASIYDRCPNCHCTGDHGMHYGDSADEYYDDDDSDMDESEGRGTRENPIELD